MAELPEPLMQLHDWTTRRKTFHRNEPQDPNYASVLEDLHRKLYSRRYFKALTPKKRTEFLRGNKIHFQSHQEILTRMGKTGVEGYVTFWHWWSSYAHSFPMSYYRMSEQSRGHGIQNDHDIMYIAASLEVILEFMKDSLGGMRGRRSGHRGAWMYISKTLWRNGHGPRRSTLRIRRSPRTVRILPHKRHICPGQRKSPALAVTMWEGR